MARITDWLYDEIVDGITKLASMRLDYAPADDVLELTARSWHETLSHNREWRMQRDLLRIRAAFATLGMRAQFPKPIHLIEALPPDMMALSGPKEKPADPPELLAAIRACGTKIDPERASRLVRKFVASTEAPPPPRRDVVDEERKRRLADTERALHQHYHPEAKDGDDV